MTPRPVDCIRIARANLRQAIEACGAADVNGLPRMLAFLETAAAEVTRAESAMRSGLRETPADMRRQAAGLKQDIACMFRVIDGCAALHRGRTLRLDGTPLSYTRYGRPVAAPPARVDCEVQG